MRSRGLVVAIAVVLALLAAAGVIVYTSNLEEQVKTENTTVVFVSSTDIPTNTVLDPLIASGNFREVDIPNDALVLNAVTSVDQLRGQTTAAPILANEQIPITRLAAGGGVNSLGITPGNVGLGLSIAGPQAVNGAITQGSSVVVYATFPKGTPVTDSTLTKLLTAQQIQKFFDSIAGGATTGLAQSPVVVLPTDFTVALIPSVKVLAVQNPPIDTTTGRKTDGATSLVLDLLPEDASQVVFSVTKAQLYLGLLPPENKEGYENEGTVGVPLTKVVGVGS